MTFYLYLVALWIGFAWVYPRRFSEGLSVALCIAIGGLIFWTSFGQVVLR